jgi:hypothetical protein
VANRATGKETVFYMWPTERQEREYPLCVANRTAGKGTIPYGYTLWEYCVSNLCGRYKSRKGEYSLYVANRAAGKENILDVWPIERQERGIFSMCGQ